jgi:hypothetical protein
MILGIEALISHQRANTRDPSINKMIYYGIERGEVITQYIRVYNLKASPFRAGRRSVTKINRRVLL